MRSFFVASLLVIAGILHASTAYADRAQRFTHANWSNAPFHGHVGATHTVLASWYGPGFQGHTMANGQRFNTNDPHVVAHKSLPFGTKLLLTNPRSGATLRVVVKDRGPFVRGRELDLTHAGAKILGALSKGVVTLRMAVIN